MFHKKHVLLQPKYPSATKSIGAGDILSHRGGKRMMWKGDMCNQNMFNYLYCFSFMNKILSFVRIGMISASLLASASMNASEFPKGNFEKYEIMVANKPQNAQTVLKMDAKEMADKWSSSDFKLVDGVYATGRYAPSAELTTTSPEISLPGQVGDEKIYLRVDSRFETERGYDFVRVSFSEDGRNYKRILSRSGRTESYSDYVDITPLSGKNIKFKFALSSDDSLQGEGWAIESMSIVREQEKGGATLRAGGVSLKSAVAKLSYLGFAQGQYPNKLSVYFSARTQSGEFVKNLSASDVDVYWNGVNVDAHCIEMAPLNENSNLPVDIAFLMDNSNSMSDEVDGVKKNVFDLANSLRNLNTRIGTYYFGQSDCADRIKAMYDIKGIPSFYASLGNKFNNSQQSLINYNAFVSLWTDEIQGMYGGIEPYYSVLWDMVEQQNLNYRSNSQKVLILIGDECAFSNGNEYDCSRKNRVYTSADKQPLIEALKSNGFQLFTIVDNNNGWGDSGLPWENRSFTGMAEETGGVDIDIHSNTDYSEIFRKINKTLAERYVLTIDLDSCKLDPSIPSIEITIINEESEVVSTGPIVMNTSAKGKIVRTPSTVLYDTQSARVEDANSIQVGADVSDLPSGVSVSDMHIYVKMDNEQTYVELENVAQVGDGWYGQIPSDMIVPNAVIDYRFRAELSNGDYVLSSPEGTEPYDYWTITVLPNTPPHISHDVDIEMSGACNIIVSTDIVDDGSVKEAILWYRASGSVDDYQMSVSSEVKGDRYFFEISSDLSIVPGFDYFIQAFDNLGAKTTYGTETMPLTKVVSSGVIEGQTGARRNVTLSVLHTNCSSFEEGDEIFMYGENDCGTPMLVGSYNVDAETKTIARFSVLENTSTSTATQKNGLRSGELVTIMLRRGTEIYDVTDLNSNVYRGRGSYMRADLPSNPTLFVLGNYKKIENGSTTCHTENFTDFGHVSSPRTNTFEITNYSGCGDVTVNSITSSSEHFKVTKSIERIPNGAAASFDIMYDGIEDATAIITISTAFVDYTFTVTGKVLSGQSTCDGVTVSNPVNMANHGIHITTEREGHLYVYAVDTDGKLVAVIYNGRMHKGDNIELDLYEKFYGIVPTGEYYIVVEREGKPVCSNPVYVEK